MKRIKRESHLLRKEKIKIEMIEIVADIEKQRLNSLLPMVVINLSKLKHVRAVLIPKDKKNIKPTNF